VTHGKDDGHGIGFRQINDTVEKSKGRVDTMGAGGEEKVGGTKGGGEM